MRERQNLSKPDEGEAPQLPAVPLLQFWLRPRTSAAVVPEQRR